MKTKIFLTTIFLSVLIFGCRKNSSQDDNTLSFVELKNMLTSAHDGDTVIIPAGICNIPTEIRVDNNITIKGAGVNKTIFCGAGGTGASILEIVGHNKNASSRVTGIAFTHTNQSGDFCIRMYGDMANFRIDHCKFENAGRGVYACGTMYGVIDHCEFKNLGLGACADRDTDQTTWNSPEPIGIADAIYVEDCKFEGDGKLMCSFYCMYGARIVFRYNTVSATENYTMVSIYGKFDSRRGTYSAEIYNNTFIAVNYMYYVLYIRGSRGVIFNNVVTGEVGMPICLADYNSFYNIDPNTGDYYGKNYPSPDQTNNYYIWNNTYNSNLITDGNPTLYVQDRGYERQNIQKNRDYFDAEMPGYVPYTYPHPLVK